MARTSDVQGALLAACARILERDGVDGLTVRNIAVEGGIAVKSVYNRFDDKAGVISAIIVTGFNALSSTLKTKSGSADTTDSLPALADRYRRFALDAPNRYRLMFAGPIDREGLSRGAGQGTYDVIKSCVGPIIASTELDVSDATYFVWSTLHGAMALEMSSSGFDPAMFESHFAAVVRLVMSALTARVS